MSYREEESGPSNNGLKKIGGILLALLAFGIAKVVVRSGVDFAQQKSVTSVSLERNWESDPTTRPTAEAMKEYFPAEYHEWTNRTAEMIRNGATKDELFSYGFHFTQHLLKLHSNEITKASDNTLALIAQHNAEIAQALSAESKAACAEFGFEGLRPETAQQLSSATIAAMSSTTPTMLRAAYEGGFQPRPHPTQLSDEDSEMLLKAIRRQGLSPRQVEELFSGKAEREDVVTKCKLTTSLFGAAASLPEQTSARVTAALLSQ